MCRRTQQLLEDNHMDAYLAVLLFFGAFIALGVVVSVRLYNSGAIGRRHFRLRRHVDSVDLVPIEGESEVIPDDEIIDVS